jgi:hypothetical protein
MALLNSQKKDEPEFDLESLIESQNKRSLSKIVAGLYGEDDSCKTGVAFCIRNQEDIDKKRNLYVLDLDQSAIPIKKFWDNDPHIICINPTILYETGNRKGEKDPEKTIVNIRNIILAIKKKDPDTVAGIIFDGADILLRTAAEYMMEELGLDIYSSGKELGEASKKGELRRTDWGIRDKKYNTVIDLLKYCPYPVILITHLKEKKEMKTNPETGLKELLVVGSVVDWGKNTAAQMYQRFYCEKIEENDIITWKLTVKKSKSDPSLTGKEYIIMTKNLKTDEIKWNGFDWSIFR